MKEEISPEKVERFYRENGNMFRTDARVKLREIVFSQIAGEPIPTHATSEPNPGDAPEWLAL